MFLRTTKGKSKNYVSIVKAYRDAEGKPKQKIIKNLGSFKTEAEREKLYILGKNLIQSMEGKTLFTAQDVQEVRRENWGVSAVFDRLFDLYKLEPMLTELMATRKVEYDLTSALKFMIATRHIEPMSKLASFHHRHHFSGFGDMQLQHLYRSLDELHRYQDEIKEHLFARQKALSSLPIDVVFFDVTTLYFESQRTDSLRDFGFSKDCKFNEVQVILSLLITQDGRPIGYELFPGNQYEGATLMTCLAQLRQRYQVQQVVIVADRGLSAFSNLKAIKDQGFEYIIASRLRNAPEAVQEEVLDRSSYQALHTEEDDSIYYKSIPLDRQRRIQDVEGHVSTEQLSDQLLCLYSSKRAEKDAKDRLRLIEKAEEMLKSKSYTHQRGAKQYLKMEANTASGLDREKIQRSERYDGFYVISYSNPALSAESVAANYCGLWKIEASFRTMKHFFQARPMFHWTPERISGHVLLNFICLIFQRYMEKALASAGRPLSERDIRTALKGLQRSVISIQGTESLMYSPLTQHQLSLLKTLNITPM